MGRQRLVVEQALHGYVQRQHLGIGRQPGQLLLEILLAHAHAQRKGIGSQIIDDAVIHQHQQPVGGAQQALHLVVVHAGPVGQGRDDLLDDLLSDIQHQCIGEGEV